MPKMSEQKKELLVGTDETNACVTADANEEKEIDVLKRQIEELKAMLNAQMLQVNANKGDIESPREPDFNKNIKIMSLYYGELNLSTEPNGRGRLISFNKYGQIRTVLYSTLIDIVNNNRKFSEEGYYYILDKEAVYSLGLSEYYEGRLLTKEIMDNICNYDKQEIENILSNADEVQKETMVRNLIDKIYRGDNVDINKCIVIGDICGINIMDKVSELKSFDKSGKK